MKFNGDITKTAVAQGAFYNCSDLKSITIPKGVTSIGVNAFQNCIALTNIEIPNGVTAIASETFFCCKSLTSIEIPSSVTRIDSGAFLGCTGLANIYFRGTEEQWNAITKDTNWNDGMGSNVSDGTVITYNYTG